jgi:hypothetical protein
MDPDDPVRAELLKELCALSQLSSSLKSQRDKMIDQRMDELAREIVGLAPGTPAHILSAILRLSEHLKVNG